MTTTTDNLAAALRHCLTRLEREGIENVQMSDARAALDAYDSRPAAPTLSRADICYGTGFPPGARFIMVQP